MLKKSLFSPARPWRAETRLFPCACSHRSVAQRTETYAHLFPAAALPDGPFEHPAGVGSSWPRRAGHL